MKRIKTAFIALMLAVLLFFTATCGRDSETDEEDEPPDIPIDLTLFQRKHSEHEPFKALRAVWATIDVEEQRKAEERAKYKAEHERRQALKLAEERRIAKELADKKRKQAEAVAQAKAKTTNNPPPSRSQKYVGQARTYEATHYTALCPTGCTGVTASGYDVSSTIYYEGMRILAAPSHIPFYSIMRVTYADGTQFDGIVLDRGGDIVGNRLDVLVETQQEAYVLGRQAVEVRMIRKGR